MAAQYPYTTNDRLIGALLDHDFELSAGSTPPSGTAGGAAQFKQWMDTSTTSPTLRIATVPRATAGSYVAAEWGTLGTLDLATRQFSPITGKVSASAIEITGSGQVLTVDNGSAFFGQYVEMAQGLLVDGTTGITVSNGGVSSKTLNTTGVASIGGGIVTTSLELNGLGQVLKVDNGSAFFGQYVEMAQSLVVDGDIQASGTGAAFYAPNGNVQGVELTATGNGADRGGIAIMAANGAIQSSITGTAFYAPNGNIIGQGFSASNTINANASAASGAQAIHITQGILTTLYNGAQDGGVAIYAVNGAVRSDFTGTAFYAPNGSFVGSHVIASGDVASTGTFRRSYPANTSGIGALIECAGGDWDGIGFVMSSGSLLASANRGGSGFVFGPGTSFSDARLKDDIRDTPVDALEMLCQTPVRAFAWNEEGRKLMPHAGAGVLCGFVAQELEEIIPEAVAVVPLAGGVRHIVDHNLMPYVVRAIQQIEARLKILEGGL